MSTVSARSPVPLVGTRSGGSGFTFFGGQGNDDVRLMEAYGEIGTVYAIVNRLASSVSGVDWHLYRKAKSGIKEDRTEVTAHAALDLLNRPNPFMSRQKFFEVAQQHIDLTGEADVLLSLAGKLPIEMWPIRPDRITPVPHPFLFLSGYVYKAPDGERVPLNVDEIMQVMMPNPLDPYSGLGPVQSVLTDIDSSRYSAEWNKNFFLNSAEPGGIIQVDKRLDEEEYRQMRDRWGEQHRGVAKAHRVAIIEDGAQWVDRKITQRDMEFTQLSTLSRDKILEAFGFPKSMLGITEDVNRANAEAGEYVYTKWLVDVRLRRWRDALNTHLLSKYAGADQLEFDYDSPIPENSEQENSALTAKWGAVAQAVPLGFDPAQMLEALGLPAIDFEKPEPPPPPVIAPPGTPADPAAPPGQEGKPKTKDDPKADWRAFDSAGVLSSLAAIEAANKWEAVEEDDDSTCEPCKGNRGKLYKNREAAYADYPDGKHFKDCVGEEFGNHCRGYVRKRKADK